MKRWAVRWSKRRRLKTLGPASRPIQADRLSVAQKKNRQTHRSHGHGHGAPGRRGARRSERSRGDSRHPVEEEQRDRRGTRGDGRDAPSPNSRKRTSGTCDLVPASRGRGTQPIHLRASFACSAFRNLQTASSSARYMAPQS